MTQISILRQNLCHTWHLMRQPNLPILERRYVLLSIKENIDKWTTSIDLGYTLRSSFFSLAFYWANGFIWYLFIDWFPSIITFRFCIHNQCDQLEKAMYLLGLRTLTTVEPLVLLSLKKEIWVRFVTWLNSNLRLVYLFFLSNPNIDTFYSRLFWLALFWNQILQCLI